MYLSLWVRYSDKGQPDTNRIQVFAKGLRVISWNAAAAYDTLQAALLEASKAKAQAADLQASQITQAPSTVQDNPVNSTSFVSAESEGTPVTAQGDGAQGGSDAPRKQEWFTAAAEQDAEMPWLFTLSSIISLKVTAATFVAAGKHLPTMLFATWQRSITTISASSIRHGTASNAAVHMRYQADTQLSGVEADFVRNPGFNAHVYRSTNAEKASYFSRVVTTVRQMVKDATMSTTAVQLPGSASSDAVSGTVMGGTVASPRAGASGASRPRLGRSQRDVASNNWLTSSGEQEETTGPLARSRPWASSASSALAAGGSRLSRGSSADAAEVPASADGKPSRVPPAAHAGRRRSESYGSLREATGPSSVMNSHPPAPLNTGGAAASGSGSNVSDTEDGDHGRDMSSSNSNAQPVTTGGRWSPPTGPTEAVDDEEHTGGTRNTGSEDAEAVHPDGVHLLDVGSLQGFIASAEASLVRLNQPRMLDLPLVSVNMTSDGGAKFGVNLPSGEEQATRGPQWLLNIRVMGMSGLGSSKGGKGGATGIDSAGVRPSDTAGIHPSTRRSHVPHEVSGSEWQRAPRVFYGPWHDRQRRALQAYFAPSSCVDELPWAAAIGQSQVPLVSRIRVSVIGPLLFTMPHVTKRAHGTGPSHVAATSADSGRRATQAASNTDTKSGVDGRSNAPTWIHPEHGTVQPEVFVRDLLRSISAASAPWPDRAAVDGGTSASSGGEYRMHPDHLSDLTGEDTADLASLLGRWRSLQALSTACGPETEAVATQKSLTQMVLRISPMSERSLVSNAPSGSEGELSLFVETVSDAAAWRGHQMLSVTRASVGSIAAISEGTSVPILQADSLDIVSRYTYPLAWKGVQQSRLEVTFGGCTLCPTTHHLDSITALLGDLSAPIDLPWVPPSLIPYSTLAKSHEAGKALFVPYVGSTNLTFTDLVWMLHANGHNAVDVPGDIDANTFVSIGLPILSVALRSEDLTFSPSSYSTQFQVLGGCVDDALARKQQRYSVVTDVSTAAGIIEARGQRGEPRSIPQVTSSAGARSAGSNWAGFGRSVRGNIGASSSMRSESSSTHSQHDGATRAIPVRSVEIPSLSAHFPSFHPAARSRGSVGFAVDVATFPLLKVSGKYTYMTGTDGEDSLGLDIAFPQPVVHATPHGIAAVLAAVKSHIGIGRQPCTTQQLEADGGSNVHSQRQEAWGFATTPSQDNRSHTAEALQELIVSLCALNAPPARRQRVAGTSAERPTPRGQHRRSRSLIRQVAAFCSKGSGAGIASYPAAWWNTYRPGTSNGLSTSEAADMPTPVELPCGGSLHAVPVPRVDMSTVVTIRLPNAVVLLPLQPAGAITPLEPMTRTQWYHRATSPASTPLGRLSRGGRRAGVSSVGSSVKATHATTVQAPLPRHAVVRISDTRITVVSDYACSSVNIFAGTLVAKLPLTTPSHPQQPPPAAPTSQGHHSLRRGSVAWSRVQRVSPRRGASPTAPSLGSVSVRPSLGPHGAHDAHNSPEASSSSPKPPARGWREVLHIGEVTFDLSFQFSAPLEGMLGPLITHRDDMRVGVNDIMLGSSIEQAVSTTQCALGWISSFFQSSDPALTSPAAAPIIGTVRVGTSGRAHLSDVLTTACTSALGARLSAARELTNTQSAAALLGMHLHARTMEGEQQSLSSQAGDLSAGGASPIRAGNVEGDAKLRAEISRLQTSHLLQQSSAGIHGSGEGSPGDNQATSGVLPSALTAALRALFGSEQDRAQMEVERVLQEVRKGMAHSEMEQSSSLDRFIGDMQIVGLFVVYEHAGQTMRSSVVPLHAGTLRRMPTQGLHFSSPASQSAADALHASLEDAANLHCGSTFQVDNEGDAVLPVRFPWAPITVSVFALREVQWVAARRRGLAGELGGAYDIDVSNHLHAVMLGSRTERIQTAVGGLVGTGLTEAEGGTAEFPGGVRVREHATIAEEAPFSVDAESPTKWQSAASPALKRNRSHTTGVAGLHGARPSVRSPLAGTDTARAGHSAVSGLALHARRAVLEAQFESDTSAPPLSTAGGMQAFSGQVDAGDASVVYTCMHSYAYGANSPEGAILSRASKLRPIASPCGARFGGTVTAGATAGSVLAEATWMLHGGGTASCDTAAAAMRVPILVAFTPQVPSGHPVAPARAAAMAPSSDIRNAAAAAAGGAMAPLLAERGAMAVATAAAGENDTAGHANIANGRAQSMSARSRLHIGDTGAVHPLAHVPGDLLTRNYGGGRGTGARVRDSSSTTGVSVFDGVKHSEEWAISAVVPHSKACTAMFPALWGYSAYEVAPTATAIQVANVRLNIIDADTQAVLRLSIPNSLEIASSSEATAEYVSRWQLHTEVKVSFLKAVSGASARVHASAMQLVADPANASAIPWADIVGIHRGRPGSVSDEDQVVCSLLLSEVASMCLPLHLITDTELAAWGGDSAAVSSLQRRLAEVAAGSNMALASWTVPNNASCAARKPIDWESAGQDIHVAADMTHLVWGSHQTRSSAHHRRNQSGSMSGISPNGWAQRKFRKHIPPPRSAEAAEIWRDLQAASQGAAGGLNHSGLSTGADISPERHSVAAQVDCSSAASAPPGQSPDAALSAGRTHSNLSHSGSADPVGEPGAVDFSQLEHLTNFESPAGALSPAVDAHGLYTSPATHAAVSHPLRAQYERASSSQSSASGESFTSADSSDGSQSDGSFTDGHDGDSVMSAGDWAVLQAAMGTQPTAHAGSTLLDLTAITKQVKQDQRDASTKAPGGSLKPKTEPEGHRGDNPPGQFHSAQPHLSLGADADQSEERYTAGAFGHVQGMPTSPFPIYAIVHHVTGRHQGTGSASAARPGFGAHGSRGSSFQRGGFDVFSAGLVSLADVICSPCSFSTFRVLPAGEVTPPQIPAASVGPSREGNNETETSAQVHDLQPEVGEVADHFHSGPATDSANGSQHWEALLARSRLHSHAQRAKAEQIRLELGSHNYALLGPSASLKMNISALGALLPSWIHHSAACWTADSAQAIPWLAQYLMEAHPQPTSTVADRLPAPNTWTVAVPRASLSLQWAMFGPAHLYQSVCVPPADADGIPRKAPLWCEAEIDVLQAMVSTDRPLSEVGGVATELNTLVATVPRATLSLTARGGATTPWRWDRTKQAVYCPHAAAALAAPPSATAAGGAAAASGSQNIRRGSSFHLGGQGLYSDAAGDGHWDTYMDMPSRRGSQMHSHAFSSQESAGVDQSRDDGVSPRVASLAQKASTLSMGPAHCLDLPLSESAEDETLPITSNPIFFAGDPVRVAQVSVTGIELQRSDSTPTLGASPMPHSIHTTCDVASRARVAAIQCHFVPLAGAVLPQTTQAVSEFIAEATTAASIALARRDLYLRVVRQTVLSAAAASWCLPTGLSSVDPLSRPGRHHLHAALGLSPAAILANTDAQVAKSDQDEIALLSGAVAHLGCTPVQLSEECSLDCSSGAETSGHNAFAGLASPVGTQSGRESVSRTEMDTQDIGASLASPQPGKAAPFMFPGRTDSPRRAMLSALHSSGSANTMHDSSKDSVPADSYQAVLVALNCASRDTLATMVAASSGDPLLVATKRCRAMVGVTRDEVMPLAGVQKAAEMVGVCGILRCVLWAAPLPAWGTIHSVLSVEENLCTPPDEDTIKGQLLVSTAPSRPSHRTTRNASGAAWFARLDKSKVSRFWLDWVGIDVREVAQNARLTGDIATSSLPRSRPGLGAVSDWSVTLGSAICGCLESLPCAGDEPLPQHLHHPAENEADSSSVSCMTNAGWNGLALGIGSVRASQLDRLDRRSNSVVEHESHVQHSNQAVAIISSGIQVQISPSVGDILEHAAAGWHYAIAMKALAAARGTCSGPGSRLRQQAAAAADDEDSDGGNNNVSASHALLPFIVAQCDSAQLHALTEEACWLEVSLRQAATAITSETLSISCPEVSADVVNGTLASDQGDQVDATDEQLPNFGTTLHGVGLLLSLPAHDDANGLPGLSCSVAGVRAFLPAYSLDVSSLTLAAAEWIAVASHIAASPALPREITLPQIGSPGTLPAHSSGVQDSRAPGLELASGVFSMPFSKLSCAVKDLQATAALTTALSTSYSMNWLQVCSGTQYVSAGPAAGPGSIVPPSMHSVLRVALSGHSVRAARKDGYSVMEHRIKLPSLECQLIFDPAAVTGDVGTRVLLRFDSAHIALSPDVLSDMLDVQSSLQTEIVKAVGLFHILRSTWARQATHEVEAASQRRRAARASYVSSAGSSSALLPAIGHYSTSSAVSGASVASGDSFSTRGGSSAGMSVLTGGSNGGGIQVKVFQPAVNVAFILPVGSPQVPQVVILRASSGLQVLQLSVPSINALHQGTARYTAAALGLQLAYHVVEPENGHIGTPQYAFNAKVATPHSSPGNESTDAPDASVELASQLCRKYSQRSSEARVSHTSLQTQPVFSIGGIPLGLLPDDSSLVLAAAARAADGLAPGSPGGYGQDHLGGLPVYRPRARSGSTSDNVDVDAASPRGLGVQLFSANPGPGSGTRRTLSPQKSTQSVQLLDNTCGHDAIVWRMMTDVTLTYAPFELTSGAQGSSPSSGSVRSDPGRSVGQLHSINLVFDAVSCLVLPSAARLTGECVAGLTDRLSAYLQQAHVLQASLADVTHEQASNTTKHHRRHSNRATSSQRRSRSHRSRRRAEGQSRTEPSRKPSASVSSILPPMLMGGLTGMWGQTGSAQSKAVSALPAVAISIAATRVALLLPSVDTLGTVPASSANSGYPAPSARHGPGSVHSRRHRAASTSQPEDFVDTSLFCTAVGVGSMQLRGAISLVTPPGNRKGAASQSTTHRSSAANESGVIELPLGVMTLVGRDFGVTLSGSAKDVAIVVRPAWGASAWLPQQIGDCKYDRYMHPIMEELAAAQKAAMEPEDPEGPSPPHAQGEEPNASGAMLQNVVFMPLMGTSLSVALAGLPHAEHEHALVLATGTASVAQPVVRLSPALIHDIATTAACWQETSQQLGGIMLGADDLSASAVASAYLAGQSPASSAAHTPRMRNRADSTGPIPLERAWSAGSESPRSVRWWTDPIVATSITMVIGGGSCELLATNQGSLRNMQVLQRLPLPAVTASVETCSKAGDGEEALSRAAAHRLTMVPRNNSAMLRLQCSPIEVSHSLFIFGQDCFGTYKNLRERWAQHSSWLAVQRYDAGSSLLRGHGEMSAPFGLADTFDEPQDLAASGGVGPYASPRYEQGKRGPDLGAGESLDESTWLSVLPEGLVLYLALDAQNTAPPMYRSVTGANMPPHAHQRLYCKVSCAPFVSGVWGVLSAEAPLSATVAVVKGGDGMLALSAHLHAPKLSVQVMSDVSQPSQDRQSGMYGRGSGDDRSAGPSTLLGVSVTGLSLPITLSQTRPSRLLATSIRTNAVLHLASVSTELNANRVQSMTEFRQAWAYSLLQAQAMLRAAMQDTDGSSAPYNARATSAGVGQPAFSRGIDPMPGADSSGTSPLKTQSSPETPAAAVLSMLRGSLGDVQLLFALDEVHATARMETLSRYHPSLVLRARSLLIAAQLQPVLFSLLSHRRSFVAALLTDASLSSRGRLWSTSSVRNATAFVVQAVDEDTDLQAWLNQQLRANANALQTADDMLVADLGHTLGITAGFGVERVAGGMYDMGATARDVAIALNTPLDQHTFQQMPSRNAACMLQLDAQAVSGWFEDDEDGKLQTLQALDISVLDVLVTPEAIAVPSDILAQIIAHVQTIHTVQSASVVQQLLAKMQVPKAAGKIGATSRRPAPFARQMAPSSHFPGSAYGTTLSRNHGGPIEQQGGAGNSAPSLHPALVPAPQAATGRVVFQVKTCTIILHGSAPVPGYTSEHIGFFITEAMAGLQQTLPQGEGGDIRRQLVTGVQDFRVDWRAAAHVPPPPVTPLPDWATAFRPASAGLATVATTSSTISRSDTILGIPKFNLNLHTVQSLTRNTGGHSAASSMMGGFGNGSFFGGGGHREFSSSAGDRRGMSAELFSGQGSNTTQHAATYSHQVQYVFHSTFHGELAASTNIDRYTGQGLTPTALQAKFAAIGKTPARDLIHTQEALGKATEELSILHQRWAEAIGAQAGPAATDFLLPILAKSSARGSQYSQQDVRGRQYGGGYAESTGTSGAYGGMQATPPQATTTFVFKPDYSRSKTPFRFKPRLALANIELGFLLRQTGIMSDTMLPETLFGAVGVPLMQMLSAGAGLVAPPSHIQCAPVMQLLRYVSANPAALVALSSSPPRPLPANRASLGAQAQGRPAAGGAQSEAMRDNVHIGNAGGGSKYKMRKKSTTTAPPTGQPRPVAKPLAPSGPVHRR